MKQLQAVVIVSIKCLHDTLTSLVSEIAAKSESIKKGVQTNPVSLRIFVYSGVSFWSLVELFNLYKKGQQVVVRFYNRGVTIHSISLIVLSQGCHRKHVWVQI